MMTKIKLTIILLIITLTNIVGQDYAFELQNVSGRSVRIYSTFYTLDTTKTHGFLLLCRKSCILREGLLKNALPNQQNTCIRVDYIAIDDSTKDTVYVKTFTKPELDNIPFIVNITNGDINKLPPDLNPLPRLMIKAKGFEEIIKVLEPIDLKLSNKNKVQGIVKNFDKETITVLDKNDKLVTIQRKEILGIKACDPLWSIGSKSFLYNCKYTNIENVRLKIVRQGKVKELNGEYHYEWKE